jgi:hypothetical protein
MAFTKEVLDEILLPTALARITTGRMIFVPSWNKIDTVGEGDERKGDIQ